jgi:hypothetical protein
MWVRMATGSSKDTEGLEARAERREPREEGLDKGREETGGELSEYETDIQRVLKKMG